jgi:hypothetical protein
MQRRFRLAAAAAFAAAALIGSQARADGVKIGVLTCDVASGWGVVFGSSRELHCTFGPHDGPPERYYGTISKFGVDLGYTGGGVIVWDVVAPTPDRKRGALEGGYGGATAGATVGFGVGVHALVGGGDRSISLQPVSFEGNKGLNVAAGIGAISLRYEPNVERDIPTRR